MPRLIALLLVLVSMVLLAMQNRSTSLPLVILSSETPAIPVGILLVSAICIGSFITVVLYGLVGLGRPPASKYRPMGQRVPYPDSPGSTTLPPSGPASSPSTSSSDSSYTPSTPYTSGSSSAFVSSPSPKKTTTPPATPSATPTDTPPNSPSTPIKDSGFKSHFGGNAPTPPVPESGPSTQASSTQAPSGPTAGTNDSNSVKKKFKQLGRKLRETVSPDQGDRKVGEDWGDLRGVNHLNSWDELEKEGAQQSGLFDFIKPGSNTRESASRIAGDIAAGWSNQPRTQAPNQQASGYDDGYGYPSGDRYSDRRYAGEPSGYEPTGYDELDQGWENFDHYDSPPPPRGDVEEKRVYGDSLYGSDSREEVYREGPYPEEGFPEEGFPEEGFPNELGPDGVYEADYRVIVPPSKPLNDDDDDYVG